MSNKRADILDAGLKLSEEVGYNNVKLAELSERSKVPQATIYVTLGKMRDVIHEILQRALDIDHGPIIAQMIANGHPLAQCVTEKQRKLAAEHINRGIE